MITTTDPPALTITDPALLAYRARIAELRRIKCDLTAAIMRDKLLCQIEQWIDPEGIERRATLQAIQGRAAVELAMQIDPNIGF